MGLLDCHYVGDLNPGFLYRLRRNLFHHSTDFGSSRCADGCGYDVVCYLNCDELANVVLNSAVRV
ncbi:Uncharacterised protein [Vibrio cholerae]|nr:Uncharacterised protein [Vibrio cholerae]